MDQSEIIAGAIGPFYGYCNGYQNPGSSGLGYVCAFKIATGSVQADLNKTLSSIVSYDRASKNGAYFGQVNVLETSSYCGVNGLLWGLDIGVADAIAADSLTPIESGLRFDGVTVPVFSMNPLLKAAESLWGTDTNRRFPPLPGGVMPATVNAVVSDGSATKVWAALSVAIAEDRTTESSLLVHDSGTGPVDEESLREKFLVSILRLAEDQRVKFSRIFFGFKERPIEQGHIGVAQSFVPYMNLPPDAIPAGHQPADLLGMPIGRWESLMGFE